MIFESNPTISFGEEITAWNRLPSVFEREPHLSLLTHYLPAIQKNFLKKIASLQEIEEDIEESPKHLLTLNHTSSLSYHDNTILTFLWYYTIHQSSFINTISSFSRVPADVLK